MESPDDFQCPEDIYEAVGGVLLESTGSDDEQEVRGFCETLYRQVTGGGGEEAEEGAESGNKAEGARKLDAPIQLSTRINSTGNLCCVVQQRSGQLPCVLVMGIPGIISIHMASFLDSCWLPLELADVLSCDC